MSGSSEFNVAAGPLYRIRVLVAIVSSRKADKFTDQMAPGIPLKITISRGRLYYHRRIGTIFLAGLNKYANCIGRKCSYSESMMGFES